MRVRRFLSGVLFVLGIYVFGLFLTAADGGPALADNLLFVLFGSNNRAGIDCADGSGPLPCNPGYVRPPNGAVEIVDLGTEPPTLRKSIDLGASNPTSICVAPDGKRFYFVDALNANVYFVDSATGAFLNTTPIPEVPLDAVLSPDGKYLYVTTREPSIVTVETTWGTVLGKVVPGQSYPEEFGGIALMPGAGNHNKLAVAATSSAPAYYLLDATNSMVTLGPRMEASWYCSDPYCGRADDVAFAGMDKVLLANLVCGDLYVFGLPSGELMSAGSTGHEVCLPLNPRNSLFYSPASQLAYMVYRRFSLGLARGLVEADPTDFSSHLTSGPSGIPEAVAFAPGERYLFIVSQETPTSPFVLHVLDVLSDAVQAAPFTFTSFTMNRVAIDAKIVHAPGVFSMLMSGIPFTGSRSLSGSLGQVALLLFGVALLRFGRGRKPGRS